MTISARWLIFSYPTLTQPVRALLSTGKSKIYFTWHYAFVKNSLPFIGIKFVFVKIDKASKHRRIPPLQSQFSQVLRHFHLHLGQFGLNIGDILLHLINIHKFFFLESIHIPRDIRSEFVQFLTVSAASHPRSARPHRPTLPTPGGWHRTAHIAPAPVFPQPLASQFRNYPKLPDH